MNYFYGLSAALIGVAVVIIQPQLVAALTTEQLDKIAEEITVLIPETFIGNDGQTKQANGSGSIIARAGNTYTVLTANYVVCRDKNPEDQCKNYYDLNIVTHDGSEYTVNNSTIKKLPGVDLALLQFNSDQNYKLAALGNYEVADEQLVFASGWPDPKFQYGKQKRLFSIGKVIPQNLVPLFKIFPTALGYDMVYTSVTYGGMGGGSVLDTEGRLIAVHGQNEGEQIEGVRVAIGFSVAIPIRTFLRLASQAGIQKGLRVESFPPVAFSLQGFGNQSFEDFGILDPQNINPIDWLNQANKMWRWGQLALAYSAYEKALQLDPNLYQAWYGKGLLLTYWEKYQEAIAAYEKALQMNPDSSTAKKLLDKLRESVLVTPSQSQPQQAEPSTPTHRP